MRVIIVGAGRIGRSLAKSLARENNEIYLIEKNEKVITDKCEKLDVQVIVGNATDPDVLKKAQIQNAELVLAVSTSDETNLVVCALAGLFGAKRRIARVRNTSLSESLAEFGYDQFKINEIINPELVAARAIVKIVEAPGSNEVADFADGRILLRAFDIPAASHLCGSKIEEFRDEDFPWPFLIVSVVRNESVIIPKGSTVIEEGDHIYVLLPASSLGEFLIFINPEVRLPKKIVIYGATITGTHVAMTLAKKVDDLLLIEENPEAAKIVAGRLEGVRIINGSASDQDILMECGVEVADVYIAASNNDQANLISAVLAKKMGAKTTIITTQQQEYNTIVDALNIDAIISPHHLAVEQILRLVRGKGISAVSKFLKGETEALEFVPEQDSPITTGPLKSIKFPKDSIIGAVYSGDEVVLANGDVQIKPGERVIVFCHEAAVKKLQALFVKKKYL